MAGLSGSKLITCKFSKIFLFTSLLGVIVVVGDWLEMSRSFGGERSNLLGVSSTADCWIIKVLS